MKNLISKVAKEFNQQNVVWGIGGSYLLQRYGIETDLNDIDILISEDSIHRVKDIMSRISIKQDTVIDEKFNSKFFAIYQINGTNINIISSLNYHFKEDFNYNFDQEDINIYENYGNQRINYCHLMDWYIIYKEINRKGISKSIEMYYKSGGFVDNRRFHQKFGLSKLNLLHENYNNLKSMIY